MAALLVSTPEVDQVLGASRLVMWLRPDLVVSRIEGHFSAEVAALFVGQIRQRDGRRRARGRLRRATGRNCRKF